MTEYIVGLRQGKRSEVLTIEAEDALIAALKVKHNHPEALISYASQIQSARRSSQSSSEGMKIKNRLQAPKLRTPAVNDRIMTLFDRCAAQLSALGGKADMTYCTADVRF